MKRLKTIAKRLTAINPLASSILFALSTTALVLVFIYERTQTVPAYIVYALTTYSYIIFGFSFPKIIRGIKAVIIKNKLGGRLMTDIPFRVKFSLYGSLSMNMLYTVFRIVAGIIYTSYWFAAEAVFYIILCIIRFLILRFVKREDTDLKREFQQYRLCGCLLIIMNAALTGVLFQMIFRGEVHQYPGLLIPRAAVFAFLCFTLSVINLIKYRKYKSPVLSAVTAISFAKAMVAMFALQNAMFASFGGNDVMMENIMNVVFGSVVSLSIFAMAVFMVIRAGKNLKKLNFNETET